MSKANGTRIRRPGAGRTKGSTSFVIATIAQLTALNPNAEFKWIVSRKQIEALGGTNFVTDKIGDLKESVSGQSAETAPKCNEIEF